MPSSSVHVLFLAPETGVYNLRFLDALKRSGARVGAIGHAPRERLTPELARLLDGYRGVKSVLDADEVLRAAKTLAAETPFERVETIDEPVIASAARVREVLGLPGLTPAQARLCRDKAAMKSALRERGIPVAASAAASAPGDVHAFVEREGLPVVVKPLEGFGTLDTYKCASAQELERALAKLEPSVARPVVVEEFIEGHEGFLDAIVAGGKVVHDFVGHYYPSCLEALQDRRIAPKIACTNRMDAAGYRGLREAGQKVVAAFGLTDTATHLEWFFGPKGLKVSEIGARPAGERIWDMHAAGNDFDLYGAWAEAVLRGQASGTPSRRLATGSVQIRPDREGRYLGHEGVEEVRRALGDAIFDSEVPARGTPVLPLDKGWHVNTWFRVRDEDYDRLRERLDWIARTVNARAV
jgi:hypothetical protein